MKKLKKKNDTRPIKKKKKKLHHTRKALVTYKVISIPVINC